MDQPTDLLYAAAGRTVTALDRFTGRPVWRVKLPRLLGGNISMIVPHGNELYVGRGGYVYCLDRINGSVLWERGLNASGYLVLLSTVAADGPQQQATSAAAAMMAQQAAMSGAAAATAAAAAASG